MGKDAKRIEITDPETGEVFAINAAMMVSDIRDILIGKRRSQIMATTWNRLSESDQQDEITQMTELASELVHKAVELIAAGGREVVHAQLDNFKIKDGTVTMTAKGIADDGAVLALNHVGKKLLKIIVADAEKHDQQREPMEPTPDQSEMEIDGDGEPMSDDDLADLNQDIDEAEAEMDEPEDLADQAEDEPAERPEPPTPTAAGAQARLQGAGPDDNPHDGGTNNHQQWAEGWSGADRDIKKLIEDGRAAAQGGADRDAPWKAGSDAERFWLEGYDAYEVENTEGAFEGGEAAHTAGAQLSDNPYPEGSIRHWFWADGFRHRFWADGFNNAAEAATAGDETVGIEDADAEG